jgi:hypothetical protein
MAVLRCAAHLGLSRFVALKGRNRDKKMSILHFPLNFSFHLLTTLSFMRFTAYHITLQLSTRAKNAARMFKRR